MKIDKLKGFKKISVKKKVFLFLKKHKNYAYRPLELVNKIEGNENTIRSALRDLSHEEKIIREEVSTNYNFYYYKTKK